MSCDCMSGRRGRIAGPWDKLPKGWDKSSLDSFWETMTGDVKHKVTKCIDSMDGKIDDPGAFCASLADKMEPGWRSKKSSVHSDVARELVKVAREIVAISCPKGWEPSSTGQTCSDGEGHYRKPEDFGGEKVEHKSRMGDPEAHSVVHNRLDKHFKDKPKAEIEKGLKKALGDAREKMKTTKSDDNRQGLRQMQEAIVSYGTKHGLKLSAIAERVANAVLGISTLKSRRCR